MQDQDKQLAAHVQSLEMHFGKQSFEELLLQLLHACLAAACTARASRRANRERLERTHTAPPASAILRALLTIVVNGIAIRAGARAATTERAALAIYPIASLLNHSCAPNISLYHEVRMWRPT